MQPFSTEQEKFWAGEFGNDYIARNQGAALLASNLDFFSKAFKNTRDVNSCLEFGANTGMNLKALKLLFPQQEQHAIEINAEAAHLLGQVIPPEMQLLDYGFAYHRDPNFPQDDITWFLMEKRTG